MRATWVFALGLLTAAPNVLGAIIYLCGDSTMAAGGGGAKTDGWGEYLQYSFNKKDLTVQNHALAGRSARSYTREGAFWDVAQKITAKDWVIVELGHNDGGGLKPKDNGRSDCPGAGSETCQTNYQGADETVQTFPTYLKQATALFLAAGAKVVLASPTPNNVWEHGEFAWAPTRFDNFTQQAVSDMGGTTNGVYFVDHASQAAQAMKNLGGEFVTAQYPRDHTHTAPLLAEYLARSFALALKCGCSDLGKAVINSTESLTSSFLGNCTAGNSYSLNSGCNSGGFQIQ